MTPPVIFPVMDLNLSQIYTKMMTIKMTWTIGLTDFVIWA
jgi:hypothetical protein